ncbi:hypothetical protein HOY82DRAFT_596346 [Tuber indicum]|nr:hypothetical protein HOY82DRAFT_596346 [Tuber indicum]
MGDKLTLHHVVALMSLAYKDRQDGASRYIDPSTNELKFGIKEDLEMNARTVSVLDALAGLCVSATTSPVFAIALQLDARHREISITISGNADKYIWTKMQALSSRYANHRGHSSTESGRQSPPIPTQVGVGLTIYLFLQLYSCLNYIETEKQMRLVDKWWSGLGQFTKKLLQLRQDKPEGIEQTIFEAVIAPGAALSILRGVHKDPRRQYTMEEWENVFWDSRSDYGELWRNLPPKLATSRFSLHSQSSPRVRPVLEYRMEILPLSGITNSIRLPESPTQCLSIIQAATKVYDETQWDDSDDLVRHYGARQYQCIVHYEYKLVSYLTTKHCDCWDKVPPFSYIAQEVVQALGNARVYTVLWSYLVKGSLKSIVVGKQFEEYNAHLEWKRTNSMHSDSTAASLWGTQSQLNVGQAESIISRFSAARQRFKGSMLGIVDSLFPNSEDHWVARNWPPEAKQTPGPPPPEQARGDGIERVGQSQTALLSGYWKFPLVEQILNSSSMASNDG